MSDPKKGRFVAITIAIQAVVVFLAVAMVANASLRFLWFVAGGSHLDPGALMFFQCFIAIGSATLWTINEFVKRHL